MLMTFDRNSAKRMYYPQTYHHIQEIQKYNIQDYRPRYVILHIPFLAHLLTTVTGWSNSKKQSEKSDKSNVCANNAATPFPKPTNPKQECSKPTIRREKE